MKWLVFGAFLCTDKAILDRGQPGLLRGILFWNFTLVQDRSVDLLIFWSAAQRDTTEIRMPPQRNDWWWLTSSIPPITFIIINIHSLSFIQRLQLHNGQMRTLTPYCIEYQDRNHHTITQDTGTGLWLLYCLQEMVCNVRDSFIPVLLDMNVGVNADSGRNATFMP